MKNKNTKNNFIVVEGLDGVGKTTVVEAISHDLGYVPMEWIIEPFQQIKPIIKYGNISVDVRFLMSVASMKHTSETVEKLLDEGSGVIMSRYVPSMLSYYNAECLSHDYLPLKVDPYQLSYKKPDKVIYLDLPEEERLERIAKRGETDIKEDYLSENHSYREHLISQLKSNASHIINISGLSPEQVVAEIKLVL